MGLFDKADKLEHVITNYYASTNTFSDYSKEEKLSKDFHGKVTQSIKGGDNTISPICYVCQTPIRGLPIYRRKVFQNSDGGTFQLKYHYFPPCAFSSKQPVNCYNIASGLSIPLGWVTKKKAEKWKDLKRIEEEIKKNTIHDTVDQVTIWSPASTIEFNSSYFDEIE